MSLDKVEDLAGEAGQSMQFGTTVQYFQSAQWALFQTFCEAVGEKRGFYQ
jgi:hypothetical protein